MRFFSQGILVFLLASHEMMKNFFSLLITLFATSASLASAAAVPKKVGCPLTTEEILKMRFDIVTHGDRPERLFAKLSHCDYFISPSSTWYSVQSLLEDMIAYRCPNSFKYMEARMNGGPRDDFQLFRIAYKLDNRELADYMMEDHRYMCGTSFAVNYELDDLKILVERYPQKIHRFLPDLQLLRGERPALVASLIDFIQYCRERHPKFDQHAKYHPSHLLRKVLQNFNFSDDELASILIRLLELGAKVDKKSLTGFQGLDDTIMGVFEPVDTLKEFKRLYPDHPVSYQLLRFGQEDGSYATEDLMKLVDRYPGKLSLFLPEVGLFRGATGEATLALIDYIEYCKAMNEAVVAQKAELDPSNLLRVVLQNVRLSDDEMATAIQRLRQQGAQLAEKSAEGFAAMDDVWFGQPELIDSRQVFKKMYPDHAKSYRLLFENSYSCIIS